MQINKHATSNPPSYKRTKGWFEWMFAPIKVSFKKYKIPLGEIAFLKRLYSTKKLYFYMDFFTRAWEFRGAWEKMVTETVEVNAQTLSTQWLKIQKDFEKGIPLKSSTSLFPLLLSQSLLTWIGKWQLYAHFLHHCTLSISLLPHPQAASNIKRPF